MRSFGIADETMRGIRGEVIYDLCQRSTRPPDGTWPVGLEERTAGHLTRQRSHSSAASIAIPIAISARLAPMLRS
jgi:hypothetical protein